MTIVDISWGFMTYIYIYMLYIYIYSNMGIIPTIGGHPFLAQK